jgi:adenine-specific DNA-methyltransferase
MTDILNTQTATATVEAPGGASGPVRALVDQLDRRRLEVSPSLDRDRRRQFGQFMTPAPVARAMAQMFGAYPSHVRLLDAGAGMGSLTAAFVEAAVSAAVPPRSIDVTAFEIDPVLAAVLEVTLAGCAELCAAAGIAFSSRIIRADYVQSAADACGTHPAYTCAILNPPYGKVSSRSETRRALDDLGIAASNLYAAFIAVALTQLVPGGEIVAITPRSFCNGPMHKGYRAFLLETAALDALHLYDSRSAVFGDDGVLQEVVVMKLRKSGEQEQVRLSSDTVSARALPMSEIVDAADPQQVIRFPLEADDAARRVAGLPCTLADLGLQVSTGRVMENRARPHLRQEGEAGSVPLIYPQHLRDGAVHWPIEGFRKSNALVDDDDTQALVMPAGVYVLTKRITAKEEARRVQASLYSGGRVAFENHLNVFHANGGGFSEALARGLTLFLNSGEVDAYIRTVSGSTQINASDLRHLRYPSARHLVALGQGTVEVADIV